MQLPSRSALAALLLSSFAEAQYLINELSFGHSGKYVSSAPLQNPLNSVVLGVSKERANQLTPFLSLQNKSPKRRNRPRLPYPRPTHPPRSPLQPPHPHPRPAWQPARRHLGRQHSPALNVDCGRRLPCLRPRTRRRKPQHMAREPRPLGRCGVEHLHGRPVRRARHRHRHARRDGGYDPGIPERREHGLLQDA